VLYDPNCRLCAFVAGWLRSQRQLVPVRLVPVGSERARQWFPALDHDGATRREITVVGDAGQVYKGDSAWIVCLWALADHRALSHTLTTPAGRRLARAAVLTAAKWRERGERGARGNAAGAGAGQGGWERWQRPAPAPAGGPPHGAAVRAPGRGAPPAGRRGASPYGPAPVWVYEGNGGWTQRLPGPPGPPPRPGTGPGPGPGTGAGTGAGPDTCADGCPPPG
jgi:predicted DCC family thiol-disulfide oxidoreductase YuxK